MKFYYSNFFNCRGIFYRIFKKLFRGNSNIRYVKVDKWDVYNADTVIATVAYPLLLQLREDKTGIPWRKMDMDVPPSLRGTGKEEQQWDWILSEIIWAMKEAQDSYSGEDKLAEVFDNPEYSEESSKKWKSSIQAYADRIERGQQLFGKYFNSLWS